MAQVNYLQVLFYQSFLLVGLLLVHQDHYSSSLLRRQVLQELILIILIWINFEFSHWSFQNVCGAHRFAFEEFFGQSLACIRRKTGSTCLLLLVHHVDIDVVVSSSANQLAWIARKRRWGFRVFDHDHSFLFGELRHVLVRWFPVRAHVRIHFSWGMLFLRVSFFNLRFFAARLPELWHFFIWMVVKNGLESSGHDALPPFWFVLKFSLKLMRRLLFWVLWLFLNCNQVEGLGWAD